MGSVVYVVKRAQRFLASRRLMIFQVICEEATEKAVEFKVFRSLLLNLNGSDPLSTVVHLSFSMKAFV